MAPPSPCCVTGSVSAVGSRTSILPISVVRYVNREEKGRSVRTEALTNGHLSREYIITLCSKCLCSRAIVSDRPKVVHEIVEDLAMNRVFHV